jgi:hypothetical protein
MVRCCNGKTQPPWADFPFVVLAAPRGDIAQGARTPAWFEGIGNAVLLERPLGAAALAGESSTGLLRKPVSGSELAERATALLAHAAD